MRTLSVLLCAQLLGACASDELDEPISPDEIGAADYVLDNQSGRELLIRFETADDASGHVFWAGPVASGERMVFASDSQVGGVPSPSDTFAVLELAAPGGAMLYSQDPIDDSLWAIDQVALDRVEVVLEISEL